MHRRDYYEVLGVERDADEAQIKRAYRKLALQNHPDRNSDPEAQERFKEAGEAYEVLRDPEKRRIYDAYGHAGLERQGFSGFDNVGDVFSSLGSIFEEIFGGMGGFRGRSAGPRRGRDLGTVLVLSLFEAAEGVERELDIERTVPCGECGGSGARSPGDIVTCPNCRGRGQVTHAQGFMMISTACPECRGAGRTIAHPCEECGGHGSVDEEHEVSIRVPAGIDDGERLRVRGAGDVGPAGPGDLYIDVRIEPDPDLQRHGSDIHSLVEVDIAEAALGTRRLIRGLNGELKVDVPAGTQPGDTITLARKGMPRRAGFGRGDHVVHVQVNVPKKMSRAAKKALKQYMSAQGVGG